MAGAGFLVLVMFWLCSVLIVICYLLTLPSFFAKMSSPLICFRPSQAGWLVSSQRALIHIVKFSIFMWTPGKCSFLKARFLKSLRVLPVSLCTSYFCVGTMQKFSNMRDRGSSLFSVEADPYDALNRRPALHSWCGIPTKPHQACSGRGFVSIPFIGRWEQNGSTPKTWKCSTLEPPPPTAHAALSSHALSSNIKCPPAATASVWYGWITPLLEFNSLTIYVWRLLESSPDCDTKAYSSISGEVIETRGKWIKYEKSLALVKKFPCKRSIEKLDWGLQGRRGRTEDQKGTCLPSTRPDLLQINVRKCSEQLSSDRLCICAWRIFSMRW